MIRKGTRVKVIGCHPDAQVSFEGHAGKVDCVDDSKKKGTFPYWVTLDDVKGANGPLTMPFDLTELAREDQS